MATDSEPKQPLEPQEGTFYDDPSAGDITWFDPNGKNTDLIAALDRLKVAKLEIQGDTDDDFVMSLRGISEKLHIPDGAKVVYPGSNTHVGVARVFGKENVVHVDPDAAACETLVEAGYDARQQGIEDFNPDEPLDGMIALNAYGVPTDEIISRVVKPGGFIIANNYTGWAHNLASLKQVTLKAAVLPDYSSAAAEFVQGAEIPADATDFLMEYYIIERDGTLLPGTPENHSMADEYPVYPDALFIFERAE